MNAPFNPNAAPTREAFTAFVCDDEFAATIRNVVPEFGWPVEKVNKGGLHNAVQTLSVSASPTVLLVDLSDASDPLNDINSLAEVCEPGTIVIAAGKLNDVHLYRDLIASGIQDYLVKPVTPDALRECFIQAQLILQGPKHDAHASTEDKPHVSIGVIGTRGGVGASVVATSLAWLLADKDHRSTALLDLDVQFGTGALSFDLEPGRGLVDALENPSRIDGLFIERAMTRVNDKLAVLSAEAPINQPLLADGTALHQLQEELTSAFEATVVDIPRLMAVQNPQLVTDLNHIIMVTEQSLASTRDTIRLLGFIRMTAPQAKVTIVANRVSTSPPPEVAKKDFEASIERKVDIILPLDVKQAVDAAKQGKALAAISSGKLQSGLLQILAAVSSSVAEDEGRADGFMGKVRSLLPSKGAAKASGKK